MSVLEVLSDKEADKTISCSLIQLRQCEVHLECV